MKPDLDPQAEQARAFAAVAFMLAGSLEVACRLAQPIDSQLYRLVSDAWARALEVMTAERTRWNALHRSDAA
jgi:hypothetical protein